MKTKQYDKPDDMEPMHVLLNNPKPTEGKKVLPIGTIEETDTIANVVLQLTGTCAVDTPILFKTTEMLFMQVDGPAATQIRRCDMIVFSPGMIELLKRDESGWALLKSQGKPMFVFEPEGHAE